VNGSALIFLALGRGETVTSIVASIVGSAVCAALVLFPAWNRLLNLRAVARRFGGTLTRGFLSNPVIRLNVDGTPAELTWHAGGGADRPPWMQIPLSPRRSRSRHVHDDLPWTRMRFLGTPPLLLRIVPEGLFASLRKAFGSEDLQTGDPAFDGRFLVQGSPAARALEALDGKTRRRLLHLDRIGTPLLQKGGVSLDAGPAGVTFFSYLCLAEDREELALFIRQSIEIYCRLRAIAPAEARPAAKEEAAAGHCPVCGGAVDATARSCGECSAAHHRDCWQYFGGCATCGASPKPGKAKA